MSQTFLYNAEAFYSLIYSTNITLKQTPKLLLMKCCILTQPNFFPCKHNWHLVLYLYSYVQVRTYPVIFIFHTLHSSTFAVSCILSKCCCVETSSLAISMTQFNLTLCPSFTILALILSLASPLMIVSLSTCSLASPS